MIYETCSQNLIWFEANGKKLAIDGFRICAIEERLGGSHPITRIHVNGVGFFDVDESAGEVVKKIDQNANGCALTE